MTDGGRGRLTISGQRGGVLGIVALARVAGLVELRLIGGNLGQCGNAVRRVWANGEGKFRVRGRYATVTRAGWWLTSDFCDRTVVQARRGSLLVDDLAAKRKVVVRRPRRTSRDRGHDRGATRRAEDRLVAAALGVGRRLRRVPARARDRCRVHPALVGAPRRRPGEREHGRQHHARALLRLHLHGAAAAPDRVGHPQAAVGEGVALHPRRGGAGAAESLHARHRGRAGAERTRATGRSTSKPRASEERRSAECCSPPGRSPSSGTCSRRGVEPGHGSRHARTIARP